MIFQDFNLFPHMSVLGNVTEAPARVLKQSQTEARNLGLELLKKVGLESHANHYPSQLSGGQKQRVAIARALVTQPACVLADEPTGNLDRSTADGVFDLMLELAQSQGTAFVLVTHDSSLALRCQRRLQLVAGRLSPFAI